MGFLDTYGGGDNAAGGDNPPPAPTTTGFLAQFGGSTLATSPPPSDGPGILKTAAIHGLQGVTSGFGDEMRALSEAGGDAFGLPLPQSILTGAAKLGLEKLTGGHEASDKYHQARDIYRKELEQSANEHPIVATGSDVAGSLVVPGGGALKGARLGTRLLRGAAVSGAQGALRGAGDAPELSDVPLDAAKGAGIGAAIGAPLNAALGPRGTSVAKQSLMDAAEKYGVQLPQYMASDNPLVQFYGKTFEQLPFVGSRLAGAAEKAKSGVKGIRDDLVEGGVGFNATPTEARTIASDAATAARDDFLQNSKKVSKDNFDNIVSSLSNPNARLPLTNLEQAVDDLTSQYASAGVKASPLIKKMDRAVGKGDMSYEEMKFLRTKLSEVHDKMKREGGVNYAEYSKLRGALTDDMESAILNAGGPNSLAMWKSANLQHAAGKDMAQELSTAIGKGAGDTSAADAVFRNISATKPNIGEINTLRQTMHPDEWAKMQAATLARMGADDAGNFSIQKLITADSKLSDAGKNAMFGYPGSSRRDAYDAILKIGAGIQKLDRFTNYSKTAVMGSGIGALYELYNDPINGAKEIAAGSLLGALLARPATARNAGAFGRMFDKYVSNPAAVAAGKIPRALEVAARNLAISIATQQRGS